MYVTTEDSRLPDWKRLSDPNFEFDPLQYPATVIFRVGPLRHFRVTFEKGE